MRILNKLCQTSCIRHLKLTITNLNGFSFAYKAGQTFTLIVIPIPSSTEGCDTKCNQADGEVSVLRHQANGFKSRTSHFARSPNSASSERDFMTELVNAPISVSVGCQFHSRVDRIWCCFEDGVPRSRVTLLRVTIYIRLYRSYFSNRSSFLIFQFSREFQIRQTFRTFSLTREILYVKLRLKHVFNFFLLV